MADLMLDKVDIIRSRFEMSYREAYDLLERNENNVVRALMEAEELKNKPGMIEVVEERITVMGHELVEKVQELVRTGQNAKIRVNRDGRTVLTIPAVVGAVGAMFFPYLTVFATVAAMTQKYELVFDKRQVRPQKQQQPQCAAGVVNVHHEQKEQEFCEITT
ncbi:MAG: DUF4342 domain-containing protein [Tumebacillaceae bacterium]